MGMMHFCGMETDAVGMQADVEGLPQGWIMMSHVLHHRDAKQTMLWDSHEDVKEMQK